MLWRSRRLRPITIGVILLFIPWRCNILYFILTMTFGHCVEAFYQWLGLRRGRSYNDIIFHHMSIAAACAGFCYKSVMAPQSMHFWNNNPSTQTPRSPRPQYKIFRIITLQFMENRPSISGFVIVFLREASLV